MKNLKIATGFGKQLTNVYPNLQSWRQNNSSVLLEEILKNIQLNNTESAGRSVADSLNKAFGYFLQKGIKAPSNTQLVEYIIGDFTYAQ